MSLFLLMFVITGMLGWLYGELVFCTCVLFVQLFFSEEDSDKLNFSQGALKIRKYLISLLLTKELYWPKSSGQM